MAELTKKQMEAAKRRGAKVEVTPKHVKVSEPIELSGIAAIAEQIQMMAEAQQKSQQILIACLQEAVAVLNEKQSNSPDMKAVIDTIKAIHEANVTNGNAHSGTPEYDVQIDRDQRGLMRNVRFSVVPTSSIN